MENEDREACDGRVVIRNKVLSSPNEESRVIHMIIASIRDSQGNLLYLLGIAEDVTPENLNLRMDLLFSITRHEILNQLSEIMGSLERAQLKHTHEDVQIFFDRTLGSVESIKNQIAFMRSLQDLSTCLHPEKLRSRADLTGLRSLQTRSSPGYSTLFWKIP